MYNAAMKKGKNKTNKQWYPYEKYGSYYKLEDGVLLFAPMLKNGNIDMDGDEVNFGVVEWEKDRIEEIIKELELKT
jgi:hypothetical protein